MRWLRILGWLVGLALLLAWSQMILGIAVFAVPDRYDGIEAVGIALVAVAIGVAVPVGVFLVLRAEGVFARSETATAAPIARVPARVDAMNGAAPTEVSLTPIERGTGTGTEPDLHPLVEPLTEREIEVLQLVAAGKSNKEVADDLVISVGTVKTHTNNLYRKLEARNRTEAVASARRHGLL